MYIVIETSKLCTVTGTITLAVVATNKKKGIKVKSHSSGLAIKYHKMSLSPVLGMSCFLGNLPGDRSSCSKGFCFS